MCCSNGCGRLCTEPVDCAVSVTIYGHSYTIYCVVCYVYGCVLYNVQCMMCMKRYINKIKCSLHIDELTGPGKTGDIYIITKIHFVV